ncbi:MAG: hypothetical protein AAB863_00215 [Patescibacteria group bacterium]
MNLREMGAIFDEDVPECVLDEPLEQHFMVDLQEYKHAVQAFWFNSGNPDNPTARSYVFYFFRGEIDKYRRPDDIMTFKVKFSDFSRIHIIDQYLGGAAYGTVNAPPLAVRGSWKPGWISEEGRQQIKAVSSGRYDLVPEPTVRSYRGTSPDSPSTETDSTRPDQIPEEEKRKWMKRMAYAIGVALVIAFFYNSC